MADIFGNPLEAEKYLKQAEEDFIGAILWAKKEKAAKIAKGEKPIEDQEGLINSTLSREETMAEEGLQSGRKAYEIALRNVLFTEGLTDEERGFFVSDWDKAYDSLREAQQTQLNVQYTTDQTRKTGYVTDEQDRALFEAEFTVKRKEIDEQLSFEKFVLSSPRECVVQHTERAYDSLARAHQIYAGHIPDTDDWKKQDGIPQEEKLWQLKYAMAVFFTANNRRSFVWKPRNLRKELKKCLKYVASYQEDSSSRSEKEQYIKIDSNILPALIVALQVEDPKFDENKFYQGLQLYSRRLPKNVGQVPMVDLLIQHSRSSSPEIKSETHMPPQGVSLSLDEQEALHKFIKGVERKGWKVRH